MQTVTVQMDTTERRECRVNGCGIMSSKNAGFWGTPLWTRYSEFLIPV